MSHAWQMAIAVSLWLKEWHIFNIKAVWIQVKYSREVSLNFVKKNIVDRKCNKTVLVAGQW